MPQDSPVTPQGNPGAPQGEANRRSHPDQDEADRRAQADQASRQHKAQPILPKRAAHSHTHPCQEGSESTSQGKPP